MNDSTESAAVARAWKRVIGARGLAGDQPFGTPDDPQMLRLRLVFHLEIVLGRPLELDAFIAATRPSEFVAVLEDLAGAPPQAVPAVFLLPGVGGDDNYLLALRTGLPRQSMAVIRYPDWPEPDRPGQDFDALVEDAVAQIVARAPAGPLKLAGFSMGGHVAYAAAARLQASGRQVTRLGIIDSPRAPVPGWVPLWSPKRLIGFLAMARQGRTMESVCHFTVRLIHRTRPGLVAPVILRRRAWPFDFGFHLRRAMMMEQQFRRLGPWLDRANADPVPLDVDTVLFRSEQHATGETDDLGWGRVCPRIRVVPLRGTHDSIFAAANLPRLRAEFVTAMELDGTAPHTAPSGSLRPVS